MKRILLIIYIALGIQKGKTQVLYNNGATITISTGSSVWVNGNTQIQGGSTLTNNGTFTVTGNINNNATMAAYNTGTLVFNGAAAQALSGSAGYYAKNMTVNNGSGVTLNTSLKVDGTISFSNGIVNVPDITKPLIFTGNALASGASNTSHINGYVVKEGAGNFIYPVGDGVSYQQIAVNATVNISGIRVKYNSSNAGSASFTGAPPLLYYNTFEHWDVTPLSTATGAVTIYWDNYKNAGIGNITDLRVAHLQGGFWLNEGAASVTGTTGAGSVTSNAISTWSPFTLGSISTNSTLPVNWLSVTGNINSNKQQVINWRVSEYNVSHYQVEKSINGSNFRSIANLTGKGNGENSYTYTDSSVIERIAYYRIKQSDIDDKFTYSSIIRLSDQAHDGLMVYPTPFEQSFTIISPIGQTARLVSMDGKLIQVLQLKAGSNLISAGQLSKGTYILRTANNAAQKIIKQ
jgi:hypothetical protein